jgi:hypothetical protein
VATDRVPRTCRVTASQRRYTVSIILHVLSVDKVKGSGTNFHGQSSVQTRCKSIILNKELPIYLQLRHGDSHMGYDFENGCVLKVGFNFFRYYLFNTYIHTCIHNVSSKSKV